MLCVFVVFFFFKQKTAYEMCGRDWSSDVCSSDLRIKNVEIYCKKLCMRASALCSLAKLKDAIGRA